MATPLQKAIERLISEVRSLNRKIDKVLNPPVKPEPDGPVEGHKFRFQGRIYQPFTSLENRLLTVLCKDASTAAPMQEVLDYVYSHDPESEAALKCLLHRLNKKFRKYGVPARVRTVNATHIVLERNGSGKGQK